MPTKEISPEDIRLCKKCEAPIKFEKSFRTGNLYPVNVRYPENGGLPIVDRTDFHSKTCGTVLPNQHPPASQEVQETYSPAAEFVAPPVGEVNADGPTADSSSDLLDTIVAKIEELEKRVLTFAADNINPLNEAISENTATEQHLMEEFQKKINEVRSQRTEMLDKKRQLEYELNNLNYELRNLNKDRNRLLEELAAQQKLQTLANTLREVWEQMPWNDAMMDFQKEDILFALNCYVDGKSGVLNANDRGMGKTFEAGATIDLLTQLFIDEHGRNPRVLWLTKKGLVGQTHRELMKWNSDRKMIVLGAKSITKGALYDSFKMGADKDMRNFQIDAALSMNSWVITNYDALNTTPRLIDVDWDILVIDEVHKLKGGANCTTRNCTHGPQATACRATGLWRKTKEIIDRSHPFFIPLSGTPIQNHPKDMWAYLHLFEPEKFPSSKRFEREFAFGYGMEGYKVDWERLIRVMKDRVIRRRKDEVGINLPDKVVEYIIDELTGEQAEVYKMMAEKMIVKLESMGDKMLSTSWLLPQWNYLSQILQNPGGVKWKDSDTGEIFHLPETNSMKLEAAMELIEELVAEGEQVVVFSTFNHPLYKLVDQINSASLPFGDSGKTVKAEAFTGRENSSGEGDYIQQRFQQGETQVLCCNIEAGGEGLNLQKNPSQWTGGAAHAIFLNLWWNPAKNVQAEDRIHRTGQTDTAMIHIIQAENTIDAYIAEVNSTKQAMQDGIMESEEIRPAVEWAEIMKGWL